MGEPRAAPAADPSSGKLLPDGVQYPGLRQYRERKRVNGKRVAACDIIRELVVPRRRYTIPARGRSAPLAWDRWCGDVMGVSRAAWKAELSLVFRRIGCRSVLAERRHEGPLVVQKPLYPEGPGVCHSILVHAPGGIAGGDALAVSLSLEPGARALITTPAATKWYKSDGRVARQDGRFTVAADAVLEWLPLETIVFNEADAAIESRVSLDEGATFAGWEITCLGRRASGESFGTGALRQSLDIRRCGRLIWNDRIALAGGDRLLTAPAGLGGHHVVGAMAVAGIGPLPSELLDACRTLSPARGEAGITALPEIVSARYLGDSAEHAKNYFESLRQVLRPWYAALQAHRPRIWDS
jgi:urease accessory protein